jgi:hypothetical protein
LKRFVAAGLALAALLAYPDAGAGVETGQNNALLGNTEYRAILETATELAKCPQGVHRGRMTEANARHLIDLGVSGEMKAAFLANMVPWSPERKGLEGLDPQRPADVLEMFDRLYEAESSPGVMLDDRQFSTQVMLYAHYANLSGGVCESPVAFKSLMPRLRADRWVSLVEDFDLIAVQMDLDQAYKCFAASMPDGSTAESVRELVASKGNLEEIQQDAYEFAVSLKLAADKDKAARYLVAAPPEATAPAYKAQFYMGLFLGRESRWKNLGDRIRGTALGTYHEARATPSCRLSKPTLGLIGKASKSSNL